MSWRIELTTEAARALREQPRGLQELLAVSIDGFERSGLPTSAEPLSGAEGVHVVHAAESRILCAARSKERVISILKIFYLSGAGVPCHHSVEPETRGGHDD